MRIYFGALFVFILTTSGLTTPREVPHELSVRISQLDRGIVTADLVNISNHTVKVWRESNTWGYGRWRVLLIRNNHVRLFYENPSRVFTRNVPATDEILKGTQLTKSFNLNDGESWISSESTPVSFAKGDFVVLIYDVPREFGWSDIHAAEAVKAAHAWDGVAVGSETVR